MTVTEKLLRVYRVDLQLRGLQSRLRSAERFLETQIRQIAEIDAKIEVIGGQVRQLTASIGNAEGETGRLDERLTLLREQMNTAKTNREYQAFLNEVQNLQDEKDGADGEALGLMEKTEQLTVQLDELKAKREERESVRVVAEKDRNTRASEIQGRVNELIKERATLAEEVPVMALKLLETLIEDRGDEAMAYVEIQDQRRHEFSCNSCMMAIPVELVSALLTHGDMTRCASCGTILYLTDEVAKVMSPAPSKR